MSTTYREILTAALVTFGDTEMRMLTPEFALQLMEAVHQLTLVRSRSHTVEATIVYQPSIVPGMEAIPVANLRGHLTNYCSLLNARVAGKSLDRANYRTILPFPDAWSAEGTLREHYLVGNSLLGVRRAPSTPTNVAVTYLPYVLVVDLNDDISLRDDYREALRFLTLAFLFVRVSRFEQAKQQLERWAQEVDNVNRRIHP